MPISPARRIAYAILLRLDSGRDFAVDLLQRPEVSDLKESDRRLATEIVMGVERWRGELDFQMARLSGKNVEGFDSEVRTILRMGIYQIRLLERIPKRAVVDDAVELTKGARKRSATGLVNAVLRKCDPPEQRIAGRDFDQLSPESLESVGRAFPAWILKRWESSFAGKPDAGASAALRLAHASLVTPPTTLRIVDTAVSPQEIQKELGAEGVSTSLLVFARTRGLAVESGNVRNTRAYHDGRVVIHDEASQLVANLVAPEPGQRVLDLCAAPGMKAGQIAQALTSGTLVACDRSASRLRTMAGLLPRQVPIAVHLLLVRLDAALALPFTGHFDRILLDAPCTGTGTLARNPEIKWRLRAPDITRLADLQARLLENALTLLAPRGRLVYATCSLEPEENTQVVEKVLKRHAGFRILGVNELSGQCSRLGPFFDSRGFFRTRPDLHSMDGFSAAIIARA